MSFGQLTRIGNVSPMVPIVQTLEQLNRQGTMPLTVAGRAELPAVKEPDAAQRIARRVRRGGPGAMAIQSNNPERLKRQDGKESILAFNEKCKKLPRGEITGATIRLFDTKLGVQGMPTINNSNITASNKKQLVTNSHNGTVEDDLLGPSNSETICVRCGQVDCPGHFGATSFHGVPVPHPFFTQVIPQILKCFCNDCSKFLMSEEIYYEKGFHLLPASKILPAAADYCENLRCHSGKGALVDGSGACRKNPKLVTEEFRESGKLRRKRINGKTKEATLEDYPMTEAYNVCNGISDHEAALVGFRNGNHPRQLFLFSQLVPPKIIRVTEYQNGQPMAHGLTIQVNQIVKAANPEIRDGRVNIDGSVIYESVNNLYNGKQTKKGTKSSISIKDTIQGREALIRMTIQGKRNDKSARGVAGPGTNLKPDQIAIPWKWMRKITKPVTVNEINYDNCQQLLKNQMIKKIKTLEGTFQQVRNNNLPILRIGDVVYRYMQDGDRVCANRQPTLHRNSLLSYTVLGHDGDTIMFHEAVLSGMNMDRDGDDGNVWVIQEVTAESEGQFLLAVDQNIMSREQARPMVGCIMNTSTGAYVLTGHGANKACEMEDLPYLYKMLRYRDQLETLDQRLAKYAIPKNSGHGIFSACLPANFYYEEGPVRVVEGVLISGTLTKKNVGMAEMSMVHVIHKTLGNAKAFEFITDCSSLMNKWIMEYGFSVSITDFFNRAQDENGQEYNLNDKVLKEELSKMDTKLEILTQQYDDPIAEQERQRKINNIVNMTKTIGDSLAKETLGPNNQVRIMTDKGAGTKGTATNIAQMMGAVGQQFYRGERLKTTITNNTRMLPCFYPGEQSVVARGFIPQSFYQGVTPAGLFQLQAGGREGILDTALNVSLTGSIQRATAKSLENIIRANDGTVRNTMGVIFSMIYGSCGFDIGEKVKLHRGKADSTTTFLPLEEMVREINVKRGFIPMNENLALIKRRQDYDIDYQGELEPVPEQEPYQHRSQRITRYEKSRIIGARAKQLENNAPPIIDPKDMVDSLQIAIQEYHTGQLKIGVVRKFNDGSSMIVYPTLENIDF